MDQKKKHRKVLRTTFTKSAKELDELLSTPEREVRLVRVSLDILRQKIDDLRQVDSEIYNLLLTEDASEEDLIAEIESSDNYIRKFTDLNIRCEEHMQPEAMDAVENEVNSTISGNSVNSRSGRRKFKLPTLEFKKFDGNIKDWLPFWSQFQKVHDDPDIDLNDKVEYLIQAMIPGSRARQLVDSFPATGSNYSKIIDCLLSRFGRDDLQIEVYVRELLKLVINNTSSGNKIDLSFLYDKLESQLRALETLGISSDKYAAMLFPLVESCLPSDLLRVWQRLPESPGPITAGVSKIENRLKSLMNFLKNEVDNEQHITLAVEGFELNNATNRDFRRGGNRPKRNEENCSKLPSAIGLVNSDVTNKCIFCQNSHDSTSCFKAQNLSYDQKKDILTEKRACFRCLKIGHQARKCRGRLKCVVCSKSHVPLMCPELSGRQPKNEKSDQSDSTDVRPGVHQALTNNTSPYVFLQTLRVRMENSEKSRWVRALIDTGSQKTYILKSTAELLKYTSKRQINIVHGLFGGSELPQKHDCYDVKLSHNNYSCTFEALDQPVICTDVSSIFEGPWMEELRMLNIQISDSRDPTPIELLIGADIAGKLYTGRRYVLKCGLVAVETLLGWTLMGQVPLEKPYSQSMTSISLFVNNASISNLWELDVLGINDPAERKNREETALAAKELFLETITTDSDGRYEVRLPWLEGHPALPSNYQVAKKRLASTVKKITNDGYFEAYDQIFKEWLNENIIEEVFEEQPSKKAHYLPHRPVIKPSSMSTKIRPVFDASAKERDSPSLNQCLDKGLNLIELIPDILLRFRQQRIGVVSDIRKAFLQISIHEDDRDFLRFLWSDDKGEQKVYRHRRVVFGINSSPFLLGASLEYHLSKMSEKCGSEHLPFSKETIMKLSNSFYVDNCVASVANEEELRTFIEESSIVMAEGKFDLRGWEYTHQVQDGTLDASSPVLGMKWNKQDDTLCLNQDDMNIEQLLSKPVTKRVMLSQAQRVFDPIGYTCPATLIPKILLQKTWEKQLTWDMPVDPVIETHFRNWCKELPYLSAIKIPRWIIAGPEEAKQWTLHTFCDASKDAFSAVVFLRGVQNGTVFVRLLAAKSRVAPLKTLSIPRLELMAAVIAVRLYLSVKENLKIEVESFFWSDSTTVLSWIRRAEEWSTFVWNRVAEIRKASLSENWHHVPGILNPADLPSRGCSAKQLLESKWWEGPQWLYQDLLSWPQDNLNYNEEEINKEKRKRLVTALVNHEQKVMTSDDWHLGYFSQYLKTLRMCAWVFRFVHNTRNKDDKRNGPLSSEEVDEAEILVLKIVQRESFMDKSEKRLCGLETFKDNNSLIRLKSRISRRNDYENFRFPIVLPARHSVVNRLIFREHVKSCHIGAQGLMSILRENYWILGGRRAIKSAISSCVVCKRHNAKPFSASSPPLPIDRVRDAAAFEITGVDFAGPLYLKTGEKVWICLFTCAVYRAVHLELCTSLSVVNFMQALRRFIARRGRPKTIYSDNGTNFVGTENAFSRVDFQKIAENSSAERIQWRFNPPTAAWWGGFWERLVGVLKQLLRKVLGRACLDYENLATVICDCESVINSRPLTCPFTDSSELVPLTPVMFLRDQTMSDVPDCDAVDHNSLSRKVSHRQKLLEDLRRRFRNEYLGQLKLWSKKGKNHKVKVGEVVFVGNDQDKRVNWPLGRVIEVLPGRDGQVRLVKVVTERGQFMRPIQRLYPLECAADPPQMDGDKDGSAELETLNERDLSLRDKSECAEVIVLEGDKEDADAGVSKGRVHEAKISVTRSGSKVKVPARYHDCL